MTTYARPQDYALDPQSDECKEWPECEMNAEEEEGQSVNNKYKHDVIHKL